MSGTLADKSVQQLLSSHAYRGRDNIRHLDEEKLHRTILQGKPVLDLYLLNERKQVVEAVRIFPGKFDPQGLGDEASVSSRQNLARVLKLAEHYAGEFHLFRDFGLVNLPGCRLDREDPDNPETQRRNLISLARYGWLMSDLLRAQARQNQQTERPQTETQGAAATLSAETRLMADAEQLLPVINEIEREISASDRNRPDSGNTSPADPGLPPPPAAGSTSAWKTPGFWIGSGGGLVLIALFILFDFSDSRVLTDAAYHAFASGALPLVVAVIMFRYAFYFLQLKRRIENTPTSRIRSVAMGMVEVKGCALRRYALVSPMTQTPCVFYRLTKYRRQRNNQWRVSSVSSSDNIPFLVEDDTGRIEVDPAGCRVSAGTKQEGRPGQVGFALSTGDSDDKWVEEVIVDGTLLYVLGYAALKREDRTKPAAKKNRGVAGTET